MKKLLALLINYFNREMSNCPECKSKDVRVAIHTDYKECNKCFHFWEESDKTKER